MKSNFLKLGLCGLAVAVGTSAFAYEKSGSVKMYLMNPEGKVDGLLLNDGTQIHFPPHLSDQLVSNVKKSDEVKVEGSKESDKVVRADTITNVNSKKTLRDTPPAPGEMPLAPPPPPGAPNGPMAGAGAMRLPQPPAMQGLKEMGASGAVAEELLGRRGEVTGVILADSTIVHFGPRLLDESGVKLNKGQKIKVTGFGTKNEFGQSIEATEVKQQ